MQALLDKIAQGRAARLDRRGHRRGEALQLRQPAGYLAGQRLPALGDILTRLFRGPRLVDNLKLLDEGLFVALAVVNERGDIAKAALFQPVEHHVKRRALLAHE